MTIWDTVFEDTELEPPASADDLTKLQDDLTRPLSRAEVDEIANRRASPWSESEEPRTDLPHPREWSLPPHVALPSAYRDLLSWSNGFWFLNGEREFSFFGTSEVREYLLSYHFPCYMPGAIPIGLDGGGIFAVLDIRQGAATEYPVLAVASGVLDFAESETLGSSLLEFCTGTTAISEVLYPADPSAEDRKRRVDIVLARQPAALSTLAAIRSGLNLEISTAQLLALARTAPQTLLAGVRIIGAEHSLATLPPEAADCLHLVDSSSPGSRDGS